MAEERIVESAGARLSVAEAGEGIPIVLLHGLTASRRYVVMGSRALERSGHRVIAYDARGHGRSSPAPERGDYGYVNLAGDLEAILDAHGIQRAVLAGASMGAHTLLAFTLAQPERVAGLAVITPGHDPETFDDQLRLVRWDQLAEALRNDGIEGFVAAYGIEDVPERWRETVATVLRQRLAQHEHLDALADALQAVPRSEPFHWIEDLAAIKAPAIVVGSRDEADPGHPFAIAEAYADAMPNARLLSEEEGASPLAWQGGQLSKAIAELAAEAWGS